MRRIILILFPLLIFFNDRASAEYCDMVGGIGAEVVWIHIPSSQVNNQNYITYLHSEGDKTYPIDRSNRLFRRDRLPNVNEKVVLNVNIASTVLPQCLVAKDCSEDEKERWKIIKQVDHTKPLIISDGKGYINDDAYQCTYAGGNRGCWNLNSGAKLKILGYTLYDGVLFALVQLISC